VRKHNWLPSITLYFSLLRQTFLQPFNVNWVLIALISCITTTCTSPGIISLPLRCASSFFRIKRLPTANHGRARALRTSIRPFLSLPTSSFLHLTKDSSAPTVSLAPSRSRVTPCLWVMCARSKLDLFRTRRFNRIRWTSDY
jgi:hypothetical protein